MQYSEQLRRRSPTEIGLMALVFMFLLLIVFSLIPEAPRDLVTNFCPQPPVIEHPDPLFFASQLNSESGELFSSDNTLVSVNKDDGSDYSFVVNSKSYKFEPSLRFYSTEYIQYSLETLQGAIQIPTMSFDDMDLDPTADPRFDVFQKLHEYLHKTFPLAADHSETVNTYGLLYTFPGLDSNLKPVVLMAHQDVVPVAEATLDEWDFPPFEAHFDGEFLYGRGTADTKDSLVAILESVEALLNQGWKPQRTLVFAFGFDEEIGGTRGAGPLAREIEARYGANGVELILDEGFGMPSMFGARVGAVSVSEKGYLDAVVTLNTPGGHSKAPPDHTAIGIMSELVKRLESHPLPPELEDSNPTLGLYRCLAEHAPLMNKEQRRAVLDIDRPGHREHVVKYISEIKDQKYWIRTSQAVDVIQGGVKLNALPEQVELKVNYRINMNSGPAALIDRFEDILLSVAEEFGIGVESGGETLLEDTANGKFYLNVDRMLEPSPISPHSGFQWNLLAGTSRSVMGTAPFVNRHEPFIMAPVTFRANTDTRHVWSLTRAIYRFKPALGEDLLDFHTVNERLRFRSHLLTVAWYYEFILNSTL